MGKTRKDRKDRDTEYRQEKAGRNRRRKAPRRQPDLELRQFRNASSDEIPDDFLVEND